MNMIGIMQGRLVPPESNRIQAFPRERWEAEFPAAQAAGLQTIEWIFDGYGEDVNPVVSDAGIERMRKLSIQNGIAVRSICADYFLENPLVRVEPAERARRIKKLNWLLVQGRRLSIRRMVIPFVDHSRIDTPADEIEAVDALDQVLPTAEREGIELHLETNLGPAEFRRLLDRLPSPLVKVNYDTGNSAALGYKPKEEFEAYGDRVGSVHIKDRKLGGTTVALETGDTDFVEIFRQLKRIRYGGDFVLQVARGTPGDEVEWSRTNLAFVRRNWN